jgi:hypothetical protein
MMAREVEPIADGASVAEMLPLARHLSAEAAPANAGANGSLEIIVSAFNPWQIGLTAT